MGGIDVIHWDTPDDQDDILAAACDEKMFTFEQADISDVSAVAAAVTKIFTDLNCSQVHTLINNAAISNPVMPPTEDLYTRINTWRKYIDVNLTGAYILSEVTLSHMSENSSIIHIASTRAHQSEPNCEGYAASKAGICGLTHAQAVTYGIRGIRVNAVLPGWIDTGMDG